MKTETLKHFYVTRDQYNWETLSDRVRDSAGELAFWNIDGTPVYIMEVHPEAYRKEGQLISSVSVSDVRGNHICSEDSADLDKLVNDVIAKLTADKPAFVAMYTPRYMHGYFPAGPIMSVHDFKPNPDGPICLLGWNIDVSRYESK